MDSSNVTERSDQPRGPTSSELICKQLSKLFEEDRLGRFICAAITVWVWLTLLDFTLNLTRGSMSLLGRGLDYRQSLPLAVAVSVLPIIALLPVALTWNAFLKLSYYLADFVVRFVLDVTPVDAGRKRDSEEPASACDQPTRTEAMYEIVGVFVSWVRAFVWGWMLFMVTLVTGDVVRLVVEAMSNISVE